MSKPLDQLSPAYRARLERGLAKGYTRSQAAGKAKKGEASVLLLKNVPVKLKPLYKRIQSIKEPKLKEYTLNRFKKFMLDPSDVQLRDEITFVIDTSHDIRYFRGNRKLTPREISQLQAINTGGKPDSTTLMLMFGLYDDHDAELD